MTGTDVRRKRITIGILLCQRSMTQEKHTFTTSTPTIVSWSSLPQTWSKDHCSWLRGLTPSGILGFLLRCWCRSKLTENQNKCKWPCGIRNMRRSAPSRLSGAKVYWLFWVVGKILCSHLRVHLQSCLWRWLHCCYLGAKLANKWILKGSRGLRRSNWRTTMKLPTIWEVILDSSHRWS